MSFSREENSDIPADIKNALTSEPKTSKKRKTREQEDDSVSIGQTEKEYISKCKEKGIPLGSSTEEEMEEDASFVVPDDDEEEMEQEVLERSEKNLAQIYMMLGKLRFLIRNWMEGKDALTGD